MSVLSDEELDKLAHPKSLTPQEQEFVDVHHRLFYLPYTIMFRLSKLGVLPKHFIRLIKTASMHIMHVWYGTSQAVEIKINKRWKELSPLQSNNQQTRTMYCGRSNCLCTTRAHATRQRSDDESPDMGMHSIC